MEQVLTTTKERYEELKKQPLIFLHRETKYVRYRDSNEGERTVWVSSDKTIHDDIGDIYQINVNTYLFTVGDQVVNDENRDSALITFKVYPVSCENSYHWIYAINSYFKRIQIANDLLPYKYFLWFLAHTDWTKDQFERALTYYTEQHFPSLFDAIRRFGRSLSHYKQVALKEVLANHGYNSYQIYSPQPLFDAVRTVGLLNDADPNNLSVYALTDNVFSALQNKDFCKRFDDIETDNMFINAIKWLTNLECGFDYSKIRNIAALASTNVRHRLLQRYFHDIRLNKTVFDENILSQFKDNVFDEFIKYRYCINEPDKPINLSVSFLADCLLCVLHSNGGTFQSFNGILDFAITHCDTDFPTIDFGVSNFLQCCSGGVTYNTDFPGFITYGLICQLDQSLLTTENLRNSIREILDAKLKHQTYWACRADNSPLPPELISKCHRYDEEKKETTFDCARILSYKNKWSASKDDKEWLVKVCSSETLEKFCEQQFDIDFEDTSIDILKQHIFNVASRLKSVDALSFEIFSKDVDSDDIKLLLEYCSISKVRVYPRKNCVIGYKFNVFGIKPKHHIEPQAKPSDADIVDFYSLESVEVYQRLINSLQNELSTDLVENNFFEIPYASERLATIKRMYYFRSGQDYNDTDIQKKPFLTIALRQSRFSFYCAPKLSDSKNPAINLGFFWCRSKECFHNDLAKEVLANCNNWENYSLYHLLEIIGFPKLIKTEAGYETDETVRQFISVVNQAIKMFHRLKCRSCGHLIYAAQTANGHSRNHNFFCINPTCAEKDKQIYLSQCYKCKRGLIDSRDSKKCPNGLVICPTCYACCDDNMFEAQARNYTLSRRPIPTWLQRRLGYGHNNKNIYYCHKCGTQLVVVDDHGQSIWYCQTCREKAF